MSKASAREAPASEGAMATGVPGLDQIFAGGYERNRLHLIEGEPGTGKTTLAMQFLLEGARRNERCLYITLTESKDELLHAAATHGWHLEPMKICELVPPELSLDRAKEQSVVYASDLELGETVRLVLEEVESYAPARVVFDGMSEIRLLSQGALRYRRQVMALKHFFAKQGCTVLLLDDLTKEMEDSSLHSIVHAVARLQHVAAEYGAERRRLRVFKIRGRRFRGGYHDYVIRKGGLQVFPRLVAADHDQTSTDEAPLASGVPELDLLVGGGIERGTSTLILGPSGSGKSSLALQFVHAALRRGEKALMLSFDETHRILLRRAAGLGMPLEPHEKDGTLTILQVDPAELSPGELSGTIYDHVENRGTRIVILDSLNGYMNAMAEENFLPLQMHELLTYLNQRGVVSIMVLAQHGLVGQMQTSVDLTYVSDTVLMLRYFEATGEIRRALSVVKKRTGGHEASIREFRLDSGGLRVGKPLSNFQGVLTGVPTFVGTTNTLLPSRE
jgi:circadian clock protein KaiC